MKSLLSQNDILDYLKSIKPELEKVGIIKLGLFGSYAKGTNHFFSDVDVCYETTPEFFRHFKGVESLLFMDALKGRLIRQFSRLVDLTDIANVSQDAMKALSKEIIYV